MALDLGCRSPPIPNRPAPRSDRSLALPAKPPAATPDPLRATLAVAWLCSWATVQPHRKRVRGKLARSGSWLRLGGTAAHTRRRSPAPRPGGPAGIAASSASRRFDSFRRACGFDPARGPGLAIGGLSAPGGIWPALQGAFPARLPPLRLCRWAPAVTPLAALRTLPALLASAAAPRNGTGDPRCAAAPCTHGSAWRRRSDDPAHSQSCRGGPPPRAPRPPARVRRFLHDGSRWMR